ncbi:MAG: hypothetical protein IJJ42_03660 [Clostridia bacterium]|nr:hypothetical protein [Clostridia bacterium]
MKGKIINRKILKRKTGLIRILTALAAAVLLTCCAGIGLAGAIPDLHTVEPEASAGAFQFRNGAGWGDTAAAIQEKEGQAMVERKQGDWAILYTQSRVEVSRYFADLVYMFYQDKLRMITYDFGTDSGSGSFGYLTGALSSVYGEMSEAESGDVIRVMDQIYPGYYSESLVTGVKQWTAADGTLIYLYYYAAEAFAILYVSPSAGIPGGGQYITNGL